MALFRGARQPGGLALSGREERGARRDPARGIVSRTGRQVALEIIRTSDAIELAPLAADELLRDDELRMIFLCCHPLLPHDARVALSLKTVGGLSVAEIARALMTSESTVAQRLIRAKRLLRERAVFRPAGGDAARGPYWRRPRSDLPALQ